MRRPHYSHCVDQEIELEGSETQSCGSPNRKVGTWIYIFWQQISYFKNTPQLFSFVLELLRLVQREWKEYRNALACHSVLWYTNIKFGSGISFYFLFCRWGSNGVGKLSGLPNFTERLGATSELRFFNFLYSTILLILSWMII